MAPMDVAKYVWLDGELVAWEDATVHVLTHALHYGTGVFEGIRAYEAVGGTAGFRLTDHMRRLAKSAKSYCMEIPYTVEEMVDAAKQVVRANAKATGTYINSILAKREAVTDGYDEALMLNAGGNLSEGSGENLFLIRDEVVYTPPLSAGCLEGITRDSIMTLLSDDGYRVEEKVISRSDLYYCDELFMTGTAAEVTPVREVDNRPVGSGRVGPVTRRAQEIYADAYTGKLDDYTHWLDFI